MNIKDNPLNLINASIKNTRRELTRLAEEKSFELGAEKINELRDLLTNPQKRILVEIEWPKEEESIAEINDYLDELDSNNNCENYNFGNLSKKTQLLIKKSSLDYIDKMDYFALKNTVLSISRLFEEIDADEILEEINSYRQISGFPKIENRSEIDKYLQEIKRELVNKLYNYISDLENDLQTKLSTEIAEAYNGKYANNVIIEDLIIQYGLFRKEELDSKKTQILRFISFIKKGIKIIEIEKAIDDLIVIVKEWDSIAQPIQLISQKRGQEEIESEELGIKIRDLIIELNNEHHKTEAAIKLNQLLRENFAELPMFSEQASNDAKELEKILKDKKINEALGPILSELDELENIGKKLTNYPTEAIKNEYLSKLENINSKIFLSANLEKDIINQLRLALCYKSREIAVKLHNDKQLKSFALEITYELIELFKDLPDAQEKLKEDERILENEHNILQSNQNLKKEQNPGCLITFVVVFLAFVIGLFVLSLDDYKEANKKPAPSPSLTQIQNGLPYNYNASGYTSQAKTKEKDTYERRKEIESQLDELNTVIDNEQKQIEEFKKQYDYYYQLFKESNNTNEDYCNSLNYYANKHNDLLKVNQQHINDYNKLVNEYNSLN